MNDEGEGKKGGKREGMEEQRRKLASTLRPKCKYKQASATEVVSFQN